jgi:hypothetical protein
VSGEELTFGQCRVYEYTPLLAPGSNFFPQEGLQGAAQQLAQGGGDSLPVAGLAVLEPAEAFHEIERHTVDFDRKHTGTTLQPLAPTSDISGAPLLEGASSRSALVL